MTQTTRLGIITACGVFGAAPLGFIFILSSAQKNRVESHSTRSTASPAPKPREEPQKIVPQTEPTRAEDLPSYIAANRWWSKKPSLKDIEGFATILMNTNAGNFVFIDQEGASSVESEDRCLWDSVIIPPRKLGKCLYVHVQGAKRFDRNRAMAELKEAIDRAEFKEGAGKAP